MKMTIRTEQAEYEMEGTMEEVRTILRTLAGLPNEAEQQAKGLVLLLKQAGLVQ